MHLKHLKYFLFVLLVGVSAIVFNGCAGEDGSNGATGATGHFTDTEETCTICHSEGRVAGVDMMHKELVKPTVSDIQVTNGAGATDFVTFKVMAGNAAVTGVTDDMVRFYLADIVPAGTTADVSLFTNITSPISTWDTAQLEMWLQERKPSATATPPTYSFGTLTDNGDGTYKYDFANDLAIGGTFVDNYGTVGAGPFIAPEFNLAHQQRLYIRVDVRSLTGETGDDDVFMNLGYNRTMGVHDFLVTAGASTSAVGTGVGTERVIVAKDACTACHNDPLQGAAHGGGYQSPQVCLMCHTPIGNYRGEVMQDSGAWLASLVHKIHGAIDMAAFPDRINDGGYSNVTYPQDIRDCTTCHDDAVSTAYKDNPTREVCATCHETITWDGSAYTGIAGAAGTTHNETDNTNCSGCHPASGGLAGIVDKHTDAYTADEVTPVYTASISMTAPANGTHYVAGEAPVITVTTSIGGDYTADYTAASLYVYGPRAEAVPVLTTGSTTDPAYITALAADPTALPTQGHDMLSTTDPLVATTAAGFAYNLQTIPAGMEPGTYMVQVAIGHSTSRVRGSRNYKIDGWALQTFQIGTASSEDKVAGDGCASCHDQARWGTMYHRSYFGTDGCIACHDNSGNHANMLANRVHAVHSANSTGDLLAAADWTEAAGGAWTEITYPQSPAYCTTCHSSGSDAYKTTLKAFACYGCHIGEENVTGSLNVLDHLIQNGYDVAEHE